MKQILQDLKKGAIQVADVPLPKMGPNEILVRTSKSIISAGTERTLYEFGKASMLGKIRKQPDKVKEVLNKVQTDGLLTTIATVNSKLDQPMELGYCNVGVVESVGNSVTGFKVGDRVVSNGKHAEFVISTANLTARVPDEVSDEQAVFTVLTAIGLQGIRLVKPEIGETIAVIGLGLIGLLTVQILKANGCHVIALDISEEKLELAKQLGLETIPVGGDPISFVNHITKNRGVDAVLIAAATESNDPISLAANISRKRGRIVLVGVVGLELSRADFYEKELTFQVSCSYGPGRYDENYEKKGWDYPIGFVRWTEQRNFEAALELMKQGLINIAPLISHRFHLSDAGAAYELLESNQRVMGILLEYENLSNSDRVADDLSKSQTISLIKKSSIDNLRCRIAFLGAGNYSGRVLIKAFKNAGAKLIVLLSNRGISAFHFGSKYHFEDISTDDQAIYESDRINTIAICTRHHLHADQIVKALDSGKNIFCEKPLALTLDEVIKVEEAVRKSEGLILMVGFNRRFSPHIIKIKSSIKSSLALKSFVMTVNAGYIPKDHWTQDPNVGGGRVVGEVCHFIDLLCFLSGSVVVDWYANALGEPSDDTVTVTLLFKDGSIGTIHYLTNGNSRFQKERLEIFCDGKIYQLNNYKKLNIYGGAVNRCFRLLMQDKGQNACVRAFIDSVEKGYPPPIPIEEIIATAKLSIAIANKIRA